MSVFGLIMSIAAFFIPSALFEALAWIAVYFISAILIASNYPRKQFLYGFWIGIANSFWFVFARLVFFDNEIIFFNNELKILEKIHLPEPTLFEKITAGLVIAPVSGLILGLLAFTASKIIRRKKYRWKKNNIGYFIN